jgi:hypothetical protein
MKERSAAFEIGIFRYFLEITTDSVPRSGLTGTDIGFSCDIAEKCKKRKAVNKPKKCCIEQFESKIQITIFSKPDNYSASIRNTALS